MFVNLHTLPRGKHMFTFAVAPAGLTPRQADFYYDEVDLVADSNLTLDQLIRVGLESIPEDYPGGAIYGVIDQSTGDVLFTAQTAEEARS